jgi:3-hydroxy-9,10-secoandrosta-1,3,5(10)-triene-9,17-dione monooxygenase reductase component
MSGSPDTGGPGVSDSHVPAGSEVTPADVRQVLGHFATGVTAITANGPDGLVGMAANSFTSVSLDPPLVLFCAGTTSETWPDIQRAGHFCVNILGNDTPHLAQQFATKGIDRFDGVAHHVEATGAPVLDDAIAFIDCRIVAEHDAGDHVIVVGQIEALGGDDTGQASPLVFFRGSYGGFAS